MFDVPVFDPLQADPSVAGSFLGPFRCLFPSIVRLQSLVRMADMLSEFEGLSETARLQTKPRFLLR